MAIIDANDLISRINQNDRGQDFFCSNLVCYETAASFTAQYPMACCLIYSNSIIRNEKRIENPKVPALSRKLALAKIIYFFVENHTQVIRCYIIIYNFVVCYELPDIQDIFYL